MSIAFNANPDELMLAVSKGRILEQALPLLARVGITATEDPDKSRKLVLDTTMPGVRLLVIRATDVPTYVEYGAADLGIAGKDVLMEYEGSDYYEPLDLGIARCRLAVAGLPQHAESGGRTRVATKYSKVAREHFARQGVQAEVIKLYGSMELAPLVGLADRIVDLVDTGNTLKANGLVEFETICEISSRLIVNKAAMKTKHKRVSAIIAALRKVVNDDG
ncbi:MAG: ATP phosphoribosyltransferase [Gammaproteobacteria bacterium]|jgi:ATP phosphoribosyltransferase|nr:ATP phosphoribosyltransferase [Gammaproteobacteria bacterium]